MEKPEGLPDVTFYVETKESTWLVDEATADTLWDAMRQGSPACVEFDTICGGLVRMRTEDVREISKAEQSIQERSIVIDEYYTRRRKAFEQEVRADRPVYFDEKE